MKFGLILKLAKKAGKSVTKARKFKLKSGTLKNLKKLKKKKKIKLREKYLGRTPSKKSLTGRKVIERMKNETPPRIKEVRGKTHFKASDGKWYELKDADMCHKKDAVKYWNEEGRKHGAKSKEVREWMRNSDNYELDHYKYNRSSGAKLPDRYQPPLK